MFVSCPRFVDATDGIVLATNKSTNLVPRVLSYPSLPKKERDGYEREPGNEIHIFKAFRLRQSIKVPGEKMLGY